MGSPVADYNNVVLSINLETERSAGFKESFALKSGAIDSALLLQVKTLCDLRACMLPDDALITGAVIKNKSRPKTGYQALAGPIVGKYSSTIAGLDEDDKISIIGPGTTPSFQYDFQATDMLTVHNPNDAFSFLLQNKDGPKRLLFLHGILDLFISDYAAQTLTNPETWLDAGITAATPGAAVTCDKDYIKNFKNFFSYVVAYSKLIKVDPSAAPEARYVQHVIESIVFRGATDRNVGRPSKLLRGRR